MCWDGASRSVDCQCDSCILTAGTIRTFYLVSFRSMTTLRTVKTTISLFTLLSWGPDETNQTRVTLLLGRKQCMVTMAKKESLSTKANNYKAKGDLRCVWTCYIYITGQYTLRILILGSSFCL